jgi:hypothetical protein
MVAITRVAQMIKTRMADFPLLCPDTHNSVAGVKLQRTRSPATGPGGAAAANPFQADHELTWRFDAVPWSENKTEAFAGLHNQGRRAVLLMDEASTIADKIWETSEGALTDATIKLRS